MSTGRHDKAEIVPIICKQDTLKVYYGLQFVPMQTVKLQEYDRLVSKLGHLNRT